MMSRISRLSAILCFRNRTSQFLSRESKEQLEAVTDERMTVLEGIGEVKGKAREKTMKSHTESSRKPKKGTEKEISMGRVYGREETGS